jgi:hypothetical protein
MPSGMYCQYPNTMSENGNDFEVAVVSLLLPCQTVQQGKHFPCCASKKCRKPLINFGFTSPRAIFPCSPGIAGKSRAGAVGCETCGLVSVPRPEKPRCPRCESVLFSPRNATVTGVFLVSALSVSGAIFLILEIDRSFEGMIQVSSAPLRQALARLGQ